MTEYWKSQAKKYCDFCKCWIADNAPNISFHDNGRKHKENVRRKLSEMTKQSQKEYKTQLKVDDEIKKMEEAAMKAYMKDVAASADLTSKVIQETLVEKQKAKEEEEEEEEGVDEDEGKEEENEEKEPVVEEKADEKWYEAQSDEGHTYYWHVETGESRWEPPEEGYVSTEQQKEQQKEQEKRLAAEARRKKAEDERRRKEQAEEERARLEREKMKERRKEEKKVEKSVQPQDAAPVMVGPAPRVDPYGVWTVISGRQQEPVDLQLPEQEYVALKVPVVTSGNAPQARFKEKMVSSLGADYDDADASSVGFKKRKLGSSAKKNTRQRLDDDY